MIPSNAQYVLSSDKKLGTKKKEATAASFFLSTIFLKIFIGLQANVFENGRVG
jgi:hypothetical protein